MNKKTKVVLSSVAAIAMSASLITGGTFALFTSESDVNIAVTSGKVDVLSTVENIVTYSAVAAENGSMIDENGAGYNSIATSYLEGVGNMNFSNGGSVSLNEDKNSLRLINVTPGDSVSFDIVTQNRSTVAVQYRIKLFSNTGLYLFSNLEFKVTDDKPETDDRLFSGIRSYSSAWDYLNVNSDPETISIELALPITMDNTCQGLTTEIGFLVEAVQGNAATSGEATYEYVQREALKIGKQTANVTNGSIGALEASVAPTIDNATQQTIVNFANADLGGAQNAELTVQTVGTLEASKAFVAYNTENSTPVAAVDLSLTADGVSVREFKDENGVDTAVEVTTYIAKGLTNVEIRYTGDGEQPQLISYDGVTGKLVFKTTHFSEYVVTSDIAIYAVDTDTAYDNINTAVAHATEISLFKSISAVEAISVFNDLIVHGNGNTISCYNAGFWFKDEASLVLDGTTLKGINATGNEAMNEPFMAIGTYNAPGALNVSLTITDSTIDGFDYGIYFINSSSAKVVDSITANGLNVQNCIIKGVYVESLNDSRFENCSFKNNGTDANEVASQFGKWISGVDVNLKYGNYQNISFVNCSFTGNGQNDGAALLLKARDDGSYAADPAKLTNVTVRGCSFENNNKDIVLGEKDKKNITPLNEIIENCGAIEIVDYRIRKITTEEDLLAAIEAAQYGDTIMLGDATIQLTAPLNVPDGITIKGIQTGNAGKNWANDPCALKSVIVAPDNSERTILLGENVTLDGIMVEAAGKKVKCLAGDSVGNVVVKNCVFINSANDGVDLGGATSALIENNYVYNFKDNGIQMNGYKVEEGDSIIIRNNVVVGATGCENGAIALTQGYGNVTISGNLVQDIISQHRYSRSNTKESAIVVCSTTGSGVITIEENIIKNVSQAFGAHKYTAPDANSKIIIRNNTVQNIYSTDTAHFSFGFAATLNNNEKLENATVIEVSGNIFSGDIPKENAVFDIPYDHYGYTQNDRAWLVIATANTYNGEALQDTRYSRKVAVSAENGVISLDFASLTDYTTYVLPEGTLTASAN